MCIIAICQKRKLTDDEIKNCFERNPHGAGLAYYDNETVYYKKGLMSKYDLIKEYEKIDIFPHVVHFRIGTSGANSPDLTHPFIVSEKSPLQLNYEGPESVLFHNGIYSEWQSLETVLSSAGITLKGDRNDTRIIAAWISRFGPKIIKNIMGKYVIVKNNEIVYYGKMDDVDGILFSNDGYKPLYGYGNTFYNDYDREGEEQNWLNDYDLLWNQQYNKKRSRKFLKQNNQQEIFD